MKENNVLGILVILSILNFTNCKLKKDNMDNVTQFLKQEVENGNTPSISYAFFNSTSILYENKFGNRNLSSGLPVDSLTTFNLFSVTKTFTALAVFQLAQSGKLKLSDSVSAYLSDFPYPHEITIEQLLSHSSGIPNPLPLRWIHLEQEHAEFKRDNYFKDIFQKNSKLTFKPGSDFKYSNLGYIFLGRLIEKISGQTYEEYITKNIIKRIGISTGNLGFDINQSVHATGYHSKWTFSNALLSFLIDKKKFMGESAGKWKSFKNFYINGTPYGGMVGNADGLVQYAQALLQKDSVLLNSTYRNMLFKDNKIKGKETGMSNSWFTGVLNGHKYYAHAGGGGGYYVELRIYPEIGNGSVILFNRSGLKDERFLDKTDEFFLKSN